MTPPVTVREGDALDWPYMRKAWRETFRTHGAAVQGADKAHYYDEMMRLFSAIMPTARSRVACDPGDDDVRLAFAVFAGPMLYYVYVEQDFRREGVAAKLLDGLDIKRYCFSTDQGIKRLRPTTRGWLFCPRFTFVPEEQWQQTTG